MQPQPILVGELQDGDIGISLYQLSDRSYTMWVKLGVALLEIKEDILPDLIDSLQQIQNFLREEKSDAEKLG